MLRLSCLIKLTTTKKAIALTEQAIKGKISEVKWREALKPLLVSLSIFGDFLAPPPPLQRPARAEHFTDREAELTKLLTDLQPGQVVTLCGPGGIGKSALAAEAVWKMAPDEAPPDVFPDGIIFHSFYNQPQAEIALEHIARSFDEKLGPGPNLERGGAYKVRHNIPDTLGTFLGVA